MKLWNTLIVWLRGLHRGIKFVILLIAAWAPWMFPKKPLFGGVLMALTTALFFLATGRSTAVATNTPPLDREKADAES